MPAFTFTDPGGKQYTVNGPDGATSDQAFSILQKQLGQQSNVNPVVDFAKSIPGGTLGGLSNTLSAGGQAAQIEMGQPVDVPDAGQTKQILEQNVTGQTYQPQTGAGKLGEAAGEALGNPLTYMGPGSLPLKVASGVLGAVGSEGAGQAAEGTPYEIPARIAGGFAGGIASAKTLGEAAEKAVPPPQRELAVLAGKGYKAARQQSGLEISPQGSSRVGSQIEQELAGPDYGFTPGLSGETFKAVRGMQSSAPVADQGMSAALSDAFGQTPEYFSGLQTADQPTRVVTAANLDTIRKTLGRIASQTVDGKPTEDAAAASVALDRFKKYIGNIPESDVVAGNPTTYSDAINIANGNYAAAQRSSTIGAKLTRAENQANRARGVGYDDTIRTKLAPILDNPKQQRGFTPSEIAAIQSVHDGTLLRNMAGAGGKLGVKGGLSLMLHTGAALGSGGATLPITVGGTISRKIADVLARRQANALDQTIRMRSPEYAARVAETDLRNALTQNSRNMTNRAAVVRALVQSATQ